MLEKMMFSQYSDLGSHRLISVTGNSLRLVLVLVTDSAKSLDVVKALADEYSRKILLSIIFNSLSVDEISNELHIPISTCYRRMHDLEINGLVRKDKIILQNDGKKVISYISIFKNATINFDSENLVVEVGLNRILSQDSLILAPAIAQ